MIKKLELERLAIIGNEIEDMVEEMNITFMEACILYCEKNDLEIESLGDILKKNQSIKSKIRYEAENLNFIKRENKLIFE